MSDAKSPKKTRKAKKLSGKLKLRKKNQKVVTN